MRFFKTVNLAAAEELCQFEPLPIADIYACSDAEQLDRWAFKYPDLFNPEGEQTPRKKIGYKALCVSARAAMREELNACDDWLPRQHKDELLESGYLLCLSGALDRRWWLPTLSLRSDSRAIRRVAAPLVGRTATPLLPVSHLGRSWLVLDLKFTSTDGKHRRGGIGETIQSVYSMRLIDHRLIKNVPE